MTCLIDTSFLIATYFAKDKNHEKAIATAKTMRDIRFIASPVLVELFYVISVRTNYARAVLLYEQIQQENFQIVDLTSADRIRMVEIMTQYKDNQLDFTDVAEITIAERLNIQRIFTFDRRDFSIIRPKHCDYFEIFPE